MKISLDQSNKIKKLLEAVEETKGKLDALKTDIELLAAKKATRPLE